jgi:hypothetical protein
MEDVERSLERQRRWLIATGIPLAIAEFTFAASVDGWMHTALVICGTYVTVRVIDLLTER